MLSVMICAPCNAQEKNLETNQDTDLVFIVDKSGSMHSLKDDTIGSFNSVIEKQKNSDKPGDVYVTTVMFNDEREKIHDRKNINDVEKITEKEYSPSGCTALLDAVGSTITELSANEDIKKNKVLFVVITDGYENSSKEFNRAQVKKLIEEKSKENWDFVFLGANIDSAKEGGNIGINPHRTCDFAASNDGIKEAFTRVNVAIDQVRSNKEIDIKCIENEKAENKADLICINKKIS